MEWSQEMENRFARVHLALTMLHQGCRKGMPASPVRKNKMKKQSFQFQAFKILK